MFCVVKGCACPYHLQEHQSDRTERGWCSPSASVRWSLQNQVKLLCLSVLFQVQRTPFYCSSYYEKHLLVALTLRLQYFTSTISLSVVKMQQHPLSVLAQPTCWFCIHYFWYFCRVILYYSLLFCFFSLLVTQVTFVSSR